MTRDWAAEFAVSQELARSLIERQFPQLAPVRIELLGVGFDNTAFRVNDSHVFRFPRRQIAVPLLDTETRLLPFLGPRLPLAVPAPEFVGSPEGAYRWLFAGYPLIPGRTACAAHLTAEQRIETAAPLGRFLRALHAVPAAEAAARGAGQDTMGRLDLSRRIPWAREKLELLRQTGIVEDIRPYAAFLDASPAGYVPGGDTLVHGDLYARHLLVDGAGRLTGVIDWGDVHLGDPAVDLAVALTFLPVSARRLFHEAYGPVDEVTWHVARLRGLWHTTMVLLYAHDVGDADLLREGRVSAANLLAE